MKPWMNQRDPLPGREAGLLPLERLVEVHTVVQLGVIIMRAGIEQEGLSSTDFPRITNVAKSLLYQRSMVTIYISSNCDKYYLICWK